MRRLFALALVVTLAACDSGSDASLVLDGTFEGSGQGQVATGADPNMATLDLAVTFDNAETGSISADVRADVTIFTEETYAGRASGTLSEDGTISWTATLRDSENRPFLLSASGTATASRLEVDVTGTLPVADLVLTRR